MRFIYGRAGCGKSNYCLKDIEARLKENKEKRMILLVPEQFSLQAEKKLVQAIGSSGINRVEVLSFRRMAFRVFGEIGGLTRSHINAAGRCMMIYRIIEREKAELRVFGKAANQKGFINTFSTTISELKRYNISPEMLQGSDLDINDTLKDKLKDIGHIYSAFEKSLHERYIDADDDLTMLAERLDQSQLFDNAEIWIDEFSGFTPQEYSVIEKLLKKCERVNIALCTDCLSAAEEMSGTDVFLPIQAAAAKLLKLARDNNVPTEPVVALSGSTKDRFANQELRHLEKNIFEFSYQRYPKEVEHVTIKAAPNLYAEVEEVAREIVSLCRDQGFRYSSISVFTGALATYEKLVRVVFEQYGIPYFIDRKRDINGHPLVRLVSSALQIFTSGWSYEAVFKYLKTGLTNLSIDDMDQIENYVLANGIRGNRWTRDEDWKYDANNNEEALARINAARRSITAPLVCFYDKTRGKKKGIDICRALFDFLCDIGVPEKIEKQIEGFRENGELDIANEYSQIWNMLMDVLEQAVESTGDEELSLEKLSELLSVGFGEYKIGLIPPALEQVLVGSIERSKNHDVRAVFVIGANDGIFPAPPGDEGILSDMEREQLKKAGIELAQDTRSRTFEQQFLVYRLLTSASDILKISYPIADSEGRALRQSIIISRLKRLFPKLVVQSSIFENQKEETSTEIIRQIASPIPTFNQLVRAARQQADGMKLHPSWQTVFDWFDSSSDWTQKSRRTLAGYNYTNQIERIRPEKIKRLYGDERLPGDVFYASVSRMEKYAACPFSYYVQYGLKAQERKIFQLNAPDLGTFLHEVLDLFSKRVQESQLSWRELEREWCDKTVREVVEEVLQNMQSSILTSSKRYHYIAARLMRVLSRAVWTIASHLKQSSFEPVGYEMGFGNNEKLPPITIELASGAKMVLSGRIDRVDGLRTGDGTYLRIIDYKSGNKSFKLSDVYYGLQIQLLTYMDALWENGASDGVKPAGLLYFKIDDPIITGGRDIPVEQLEKEIQKKLKMKGLLLSDVRLIREMDTEIDGDSLIIPARINKDGGLGRASAATLEQFEYLKKHVRKLLNKLGEEMLSGKADISPYKKRGSNACAYCSYGAICQFDTDFKGNAYRFLTDKKDAEIWQMLQTENPEEGGAH